MISQIFKNIDNSLPSNHFQVDGIEYKIVRTEGNTWESTTIDFRDITTNRKFTASHIKFIDWLEKKQAIFLKGLASF